MIIGAPGSGKSTLARQVGDLTGLPVVHMDKVFWQPGWVERPKDDRLRLALAAELPDQWVIDGNFSATWPGRSARADLVVWLDLPLILRFWRVIGRIWQWQGRVRPDMQADCPERLDLGFLWYILHTSRQTRRQSLTLLASLPAEKVRHLDGTKAVKGWIGRVNAEGLPG